jgi:hypothetical protein
MTNNNSSEFQQIKNIVEDMPSDTEQFEDAT